MPNERTYTANRNVYLGEKLASALSAHCERRGLQQSEFIRSAVADALGKAELAAGIAPGRPPAEYKTKKTSTHKRAR